MYTEHMRQLFFVHGGDSLKPEEDFFAHWESDAAWKVTDPFTSGSGRKKWKDDMCEKLASSFVCAAPRFPNDMDAHYAQWRWWFDKHVPFMRDGIVLVGHSLGGNFLGKYLAEQAMPIRVAQLHLVAPAWGEGDFTMPEDLSSIGAQVEHVYIYHSTDDAVVPFAHGERFAAAIPSAEFVRFTDRNHFFAQHEFPELLERVQRY